MLFSELQTEFFRRGFDYLNDAGNGLLAAKRFINDGYHEICETEDWPFLQTDASGAAPLTIATTRKVLTVRQGTVLLTMAEHRWLAEIFGDVTTAGTPEYYWLDQSASTTAVRVFPTNVASITVRHIAIPADLSAGTDVAVIPTRYHELIVQSAVRRAYLDSDNFAAAQGVHQEIQIGLAEMRNAYLRDMPMRAQRGTQPTAGETSE